MIDGGHFIPHDSPEQLNSILGEFLNDLPQPTGQADRKAKFNRSNLPTSWVKGSADVLMPGVTMKIIKRTEGQQVYKHSFVTFNYKCKIASGPQKDKSCGTDTDVNILLGADKVFEGLDTALPFMRVGEIAVIYLPWQHGFGEDGNTDMGVGPKSDVEFEVEMTSS